MSLPPPRFTVGRFRSGYDIGEVDDFLDEVQRRLSAAPSEELAIAIVEKRFSLTAMRPGYDMDQVDDYLDRVVAMIRAGGPVVDRLDQEPVAEVDAPELDGRPDFPSPGLLREGYDAGEVARFLDQIEPRVRRSPHPRLAEEITGQRFTSTRRGGLRQDAVDAYLERLAHVARTGRG